MPGSVWLSPTVMSKNPLAYVAGSLASEYSAGLIRPSPPPLICAAIATRPAHSGVAREVPPMSYQPVEHGFRSGGQRRPPLPSGGSDRYTSDPVRGDDCSATSGTPRALGGIGVLPGGRVAWYDGRANTWLKPPPVAMPRL